ncbi:MAG: Stp1/IreP family PP2C-type Ser/Thr phosphatase [bacterium]
MKIRFAGTTDVGRVRDHNEDYFAIVPEQNLAVVCDGMGGHAAGEVASRIAVETIFRIFDTQDHTMFDRAEFPYPVETVSPLGKLLLGAIAVANQRVFDAGNKRSELTGMGTTVVACSFHDGGASICHAGDSRVYLFRNGELRQLTSDHSWVNELMQQYNMTEEESKAHVNSNVITRALGTRQEIKIDIAEVRLAAGDLLLLCSDGLSGMVNDELLRETMAELQSEPQQLVERLVELANENGGVDNVTACVAEVLETDADSSLTEIDVATVDWGSGTSLEEVYQMVGTLFSESEAAPTDPPGGKEVTRIEAKKKSVNRR